MVSRANYVFDGWDAPPAATMPDNDLTYTAQWTPAEASVTVEGEDPTYYATVAEAFTAAHGKTDPTVKILKEEVTIASEITISASMTIDLNGKTISSAVTTAATGVFKINASGKTVTITDSGTGGKISHIANCAGYVYGINLFAGSLNVEGGYIYAENTYATAGTAYRACGIMYADKQTNPASLTVSDGTIEAKRASTYVYGISIYTGNCGLTMTGGTVKASGGNGLVRGIYTQGTAELTDVTVTATAALTGTANCYAVFSDKDGKYTINSGTYTATSTSTGTNAYAISLTKASSATTGGSAIVKGGRFSGKSKELNISNGTITLQGGYYVHNTDLAVNCATNYHVLPNADANYPYKVAEAYNVTFNNYDGTELQSGLVEKGQNPVYTEATPTKSQTDKYSYTFSGWDPAVSAVTGAATYTAQFNSTIRTYAITWKNRNGSTLREDQVAYDKWPEYGSVPTCDPTESQVFEFRAWTPEITVVTGAKTYTADYTASPRQYPVIWKNYDGSPLKTIWHNYGWEDIPAADTYDGATPTRPIENGKTYTFKG